MAVTRAAPTAIRVICQPAMPPAVTTGTAGAGTGASGAPPGGSRTSSAAEAAGTRADASRAQMTAATAAASRRGRAAACRAKARRSEPVRGMRVNMMASCVLCVLAGQRVTLGAVLDPAWSAGLESPWTGDGMVSTRCRGGVRVGDLADV